LPQQTHAPNKCEAVVSTCLLCGGPHATAIMEIHNTPSIKIKNFTSYIRLSTVNRARGVALLVASSIANTKHDLPPHLSDLEAVAADIQFNNSIITLISYYNPPKEPLSTQLFQYASNLNRSIILGDFNARHTDFGDTSSNTNGKTFSKLISELPIYRLENRTPTHIAGSVLDHIVISENGKYTEKESTFWD
jgi:hypothetical protein